MLALLGEDVVGDPEQSGHLDRHPVLLLEFPHHRGRHGLPELDAATGELPAAPLVGRRRPALGEKHPAPVVEDHRTHADLRGHWIPGSSTTAAPSHMKATEARMKMTIHVSYQRQKFPGFGGLRKPGRTAVSVSSHSSRR